MKDLKEEFLKEEVWILAYGGAFQRANVYKNDVNEESRKAFKIMLRSFIEEVIIPQYQLPINYSDQEHLEFIHQVMDYSKSFKEILNNGQLNLGVAQKLLNLILKYYWTLDIILEPPHFPIDRIIQQHIDSSYRITWTQMTKDEEYLQVINAVRDQVLGKDETLATWELTNFNRR